MLSSVICLLVVGVSSCRAEDVPRSAGPKPNEIADVQLVTRRVWFIADHDRLWETEDGGSRWSTVFQKNSGSPRRLLDCFKFFDPNVGFVIDQSTVSRTFDGGRTWQVLGKIPAVVNGCAFPSLGYGWAIGTVDSSGSRKPVLFATNDGGKTWKEQQLPTLTNSAPLSDVFFVDVMRGWAVGDGAIIRTEDGGQTWSTCHSSESSYRRVFFVDSNLGWATEKEGTEFVATKDGGQHWTEIPGPPGYGSWPTNPACTSPEQCLASVMRLYTTRDGGKHWTRVQGPFADQGISTLYLGIARDHHLVALTQTGAAEVITGLVSEDAGRSWHPAMPAEQAQPSSSNPPKR